VNDYGNDGGVEREEKQKPFPSLPTPPWKLAKTASFPHSHSLGDDLGFPFSPSSFNFNIDESVTYMPGTFCYRHPRSHTIENTSGFSPWSIALRPRADYFRSLFSRAVGEEISVKFGIGISGISGTGSAGINRHIVGDARALRKRRSDSILASSLACDLARDHSEA
jgi:hypothetical protein